MSPPMTDEQGTPLINGSSEKGPNTTPVTTQGIPTSKPSPTNSPQVTPESTPNIVNLNPGSTHLQPVMSRAATPNATPISLPMQSGVQLVNMRPNSNVALAAQRGISPRMLIRPGVFQTIHNVQNAGPTNVLLKTESGLQLVRLQNSSAVSQLGSNGTSQLGTHVVVQPNNSYRLQHPQTSNAVQNQVTGSVATTHVNNVNTAAPTPATLSMAAPTSTPSAIGTQTITAESAKSKCKNFLATLLRLAGDQHAKVAKSVQNLIQGLINGSVQPERFTEELQKDLNSSPQPCLVPFLKKTLPYLRVSLASGEIKIDGIDPPLLSSVPAVTGPTSIPSIMTRPIGATQNSNQVRLVNPSTTSATVIQRPSGQQTPGSNARYVSVQQVKMGSKALSSVKAAPSLSQPHPMGGLSPMNGTMGSGMKTFNRLPIRDDKKGKDKGGTLSNFNTSSVADDDINDVAAMGGVNLGEETQKILESTGYVGTQIRSCKDDTFLNPSALFNKMKHICAENGLEEPSKEVIALVSHATQQRLKELVEKLGAIAEHRLDIIKGEDNYEVSRDTKGQLKFLEELDKLEKKKKDEQEREILMKAAKSRSKTEDPEQARLKAKAKEMQRVEMEESLKKDANLTALSALQGSRKRPRPMDDDAEGTFSGTFTQRKMPMRRRVTRVSVRDMQFLMEQDKDLSKSSLLYKFYLK